MSQATDTELLARLQQGDESAFMWLVDQYHAAMVRIAFIYVEDRPMAEDVVQETWLGVLKGIRKFEARSSLKTWIFSILVNRAKTRAEKEKRFVPFSTWEDSDDGQAEATVDSQRFYPADHSHWPHGWLEAPQGWAEEQLLSNETQAIIQQAISDLTPNQRTVITLRDIDGLDSNEVCNVLEISETNQRVLLHRARAAVRRALERYMEKVN